MQAKSHPGWIEIVQEIKNISQLPRFNPNDKNKNQEVEWIFHSGRFKENERILQLLIKE